ncbi:MAG: putative Flagellar M-ring protein FliF, partial [Alphaproteobacteria bacterium]
MADTELPQSQSSWRQWRAVGLIGVALSAPLAAGYFYFLRPQYAPLFSNLRTEEAAAIVTELKRQSIPYKLADGGGAVLVEKTRVDAARVALSGSDLSIHGLDGFELFNDSDMGLTEFAQRIRYQRALQGELARTILKIDGVADVRVHISLPERTMFEAEADRPKAAVSLTLRGSGTSNGDQVLGIQRLVAASVDGLALADVVVLDSSGRVISPADPSAPSNAVAEARAAAPVATPRRDGAGEREAGGGVAGSKAVSPTGETAGGRPAGE